MAIVSNRPFLCLAAVIGVMSFVIGFAGGYAVSSSKIEELRVNGASLQTVRSTKAESELAKCRNLNQVAVEKQAEAVCGLRTKAFDALLFEKGGSEERRRGIRNARRSGLEDAVGAERDAVWREIERADQILENGAEFENLVREEINK